jgi:hypothetical protein
MRPQHDRRKHTTGKVVTTRDQKLVPTACPKAAFSSPELTEIVDAWPSLPQPLRASLLMLIRAAKKAGEG